jgi:hypothetical protein
MSEKKIDVPNGMLIAALSTNPHLEFTADVRQVLEVALRWPLFVEFPHAGKYEVEVFDDKPPCLRAKFEEVNSKPEEP